MRTPQIAIIPATQRPHPNHFQILLNVPKPPQKHHLIHIGYFKNYKSEKRAGVKRIAFVSAWLIRNGLKIQLWIHRSHHHATSGLISLNHISLHHVIPIQAHLTISWRDGQSATPSNQNWTNLCRGKERNRKKNLGEKPMYLYRTQYIHTLLIPINVKYIFLLKPFKSLWQVNAFYFGRLSPILHEMIWVFFLKNSEA